MRKTEERHPLDRVRRSPVSQRTAPREREAVMHFSPDSQSSEAASELLSSRLPRIWSEAGDAHPQPKENDLNGLAEHGHAVPSKRSSPPAEKCAVCIGGLGRSQGAKGRKIEVFGHVHAARGYRRVSIAIESGASSLMNTGCSACDWNCHVSPSRTHSLIRSAISIGGFDCDTGGLAAAP